MAKAQLTHVRVLDLAAEHGIPRSTLYHRLRKHPDYLDWPRENDAGGTRLVPANVVAWLIAPRKRGPHSEE